MSDNTNQEVRTFAGPTVKVPRNLYLCRYTNGEDRQSASGNRMIVGSAEIISPDFSPDHADQTIQYQVGGRRFKSYFVYDVGAKNHESVIETLKRIGLLDESAPSVLEDEHLDAVLEKMKSYKHCFYALVDSEEDIAAYPPKPGERVGQPIMHPVTGKPITRGWRIKMLNTDDYVGVAETPEDLPIPQNPY